MTTKPWQIGELPGKVKGNPFLVSWFVRDSRPGMSGYNNLDRRFPTEREAVEAAGLPLVGAFRVTVHHADRQSPVKLILDRRAK